MYVCTSFGLYIYTYKYIHLLYISSSSIPSLCINQHVLLKITQCVYVCVYISHIFSLQSYINTAISNSNLTLQG